MKPGPDMDTEVAEKVMGIKVCHDSICMGCNNVIRPEPYSTEIAAAWTVAERIGLSVLKVDGGWQARRFVSSVDPCSSNGATAPEAICLAALAAVAPPVQVASGAR